MLPQLACATSRSEASHHPHAFAHPSNQDYGLGAGFFYLGYGVAHVPSTFLTMRIGARWWYSSITIAWGIVALCAAAIQDRTGLCLQRFFLGVAEAGAFPSAIHLLAQFYPRET